MNCGCWCGLVHPGADVCDNNGTTERVFLTHGEPARTTMCAGCAAELDRLRAKFGRDPREV